MGLQAKRALLDLTPFNSRLMHFGSPVLPHSIVYRTFAPAYCFDMHIQWTLWLLLIILTLSLANWRRLKGTGARFSVSADHTDNGDRITQVLSDYRILTVNSGVCHKRRH